jgi:hypothetical protein
MVLDRTQAVVDNAEELIRLASEFLTEEPPPPSRQLALEEAIQHAHQLVAAELSALDRAREAKQELDPGTLFREHTQEKIAALVFIAKHLFFDIAPPQPDAAPLEVQLARQDSAQYMQLLFHLRAVDGLALLFDCAANAPHTNDNIKFWQQVALHCLHTMALIPDARQHIIAFLTDRPGARRMVESMMNSADAQVAAHFRALGEEYVRLKRANVIMQLPPPPKYIELFAQYDRSVPEGRTVGYASWLCAQRRITQAVKANDFTVVTKWVAEGSPRTARLAFTTVQRSIPAKQYAVALEQMLAHETMSAVRLAAAVLELGKINRAAQPKGGEQRINNILIDLACSGIPARIGVAKVAVHQLEAVDAFNELIQILEQAVIVEVAEEAVYMLRNLRRLPIAESVARKRVLLQPAFERARADVQKAHNIMEAAFASPSDEIASMYLDQLKELGALPEIQQLSQKRTRISELAKQTLVELQMENSTDRLL